MIDFNSKYALVTGGSRGIGRAVCINLASYGYNILINYKSNEKEALITKSLVEEHGKIGELLPFDVSDSNQVELVLEKWTNNNSEQFIEVLINNAGIRDDGLMVFLSSSQWKNVVSSSLDGFYNVTRSVINGMISRRYGRIINIVSLSGLKGMPGQTNYAAAKAGVIGATKSLAQEVARRNITVNAIAPGFIKTDMTKDLNEGELRKLIPCQRFGEPEEVAHAVRFLASPEASYITGHVLSVNGGLYS